MFLGADLSGVGCDDAGWVLVDYMQELGVMNGIEAVGYSTEDIPASSRALCLREGGREGGGREGRTNNRIGEGGNES